MPLCVMGSHRDLMPQIEALATGDAGFRFWEFPEIGDPIISYPKYKDPYYKDPKIRHTPNFRKLPPEP